MFEYENNQSQFDTKEPSLRFQDLKENEKRFDFVLVYTVKSNEEDILISESNDGTLPRRSSKKDRVKYRTKFLNNLWNYGLKIEQV